MNWALLQSVRLEQAPLAAVETKSWRAAVARQTFENLLKFHAIQPGGLKSLPFFFQK